MDLPVHYDPRDITKVHVRTPGGVLVMAEVTTPNIAAISLAEWQARRHQERSASCHPDLIAQADASQKRGDELISEAKASRKVRRRKATESAGDRFRVEQKAGKDAETKTETTTQSKSDPEPVVLDRPIHIFEVEGYENEY